MSKVKIAVQTITFGDNQRDDFPSVFAAVAASGANGVEIGYRHVAEYDPAKLKRELKDAGLELVALHMGGNLVDTSQAAGERQAVDKALDLLEALSCSRLIYSGLKTADEDVLTQDLAKLNTAALRCDQRGVKLLFHNHNWEFANKGHIMRRLLQESVPLLGLCPDIGWIHVGGADAMAFLADNLKRLGAIHFKDFTAAPPEGDTIELGRGCAPLREAAAWMVTKCPHLWAIAEQDRSKLQPAEAVAFNSKFLKETLV